MAGHYTAASIAKKLGVTRRSVLRVAKRIGVGFQVSGRLWLFSQEHFERILVAAKLRRGNPNFGRPATTDSPASAPGVSASRPAGLPPEPRFVPDDSQRERTVEEADR